MSLRFFELEWIAKADATRLMDRMDIRFGRSSPGGTMEDFCPGAKSIQALNYPIYQTRSPFDQALGAEKAASP